MLLKGLIPLHGPDRTGPDPTRQSLRTLSETGKIHNTGPTGPDRTRTDFFAARVSDKLRWVRAGPVGSGRARVVELSL